MRGRRQCRRFGCQPCCRRRKRGRYKSRRLGCNTMCWHDVKARSTRAGRPNPNLGESNEQTERCLCAERKQMSRVGRLRNNEVPHLGMRY